MHVHTHIYIYVHYVGILCMFMHACMLCMSCMLCMYMSVCYVCTDIHSTHTYYTYMTYIYIHAYCLPAYTRTLPVCLHREGGEGRRGGRGALRLPAIGTGRRHRPFVEMAQKGMIGRRGSTAASWAEKSRMPGVTWIILYVRTICPFWPRGRRRLAKWRIRSKTVSCRK